MVKPRAVKPLRLDWFVLVVVAGGLVEVVTVITGTAMVPVQLAARAAVLAVALLALAEGRARRAPTRLFLPAFLWCCSGIASFWVALFFRQEPLADAWLTFLFMFGLPIFVLVPMLFPTSISPSRGMTAFAGLSVLFGLAQVLLQDLLIPDQARFRFGIAFESFVGNGRLRATGFFASPARYAEFLVFVCLYAQRSFLTSSSARVRWLLAVGLLTFILINTYSRAALIALAVGTLVQSTLLRQQITAIRGVGRLGYYAWISMLVFGGAGSLVWAPGSEATLLDATSFGARRQHWSDVLETLVEASATDLLFGQGFAARFSPVDPRYFVVDNLYLAIVLYSGLVGMVFFVWMVSAALSAARRNANLGQLTSLLSLLSGLLVSGFLVDNHNTVGLVVFCMFAQLSTLGAGGLRARSGSRDRSGSLL